MENKTINEFKIWLKRIEPIDMYEDVNEVRLAFIYSVKEHMSNYLVAERTINSSIDPVVDFGIWLNKFYKNNVIILFYKNYKYVISEEKLDRKVKMYGDI